MVTKIAIYFFIVFLMSLVVYHNYPSRWRDKTWKKVALLAFHILGFILLEGTLFFIHLLPSGILKTTITIFATLCFVEIHLMFLFLVTSWLYRFICRKSKHDKNRLYRGLNNQDRNMRICLIVTTVFFLIGFINSFPLHTIYHDVPITVSATTQESDCRIVQIADLHLGGGCTTEDVDRLVQRINDVDPDVVVLVGDCADTTTSQSELAYFAKAFKQVHANYGMYFVTGNHDYECHFDFEPYIEEAGFTILHDSAALLPCGIALVGVDDKDYSNPQIVANALETADIDASTPVILLQHEPKKTSLLKDSGVDVVLSGHTHGYQFPFYNLYLSLHYKPVYGEADIEGIQAITTSGANDWVFRYKWPSCNELMVLNVQLVHDTAAAAA